MSSVCATSSPPRSGGSSAHRARQGTQRQALLATRSAGGAGTETAASADISSSCARPQVRSPQAVRGLLRGRVQEWRTPSRERPRRACPSPQSSEAFRALRPAERRGPSAISPNRDDLPLIAARASRTWPQHCSSLLHGNHGASLISPASAQPRSPPREKSLGTTEGLTCGPRSCKRCRAARTSRCGGRWAAGSALPSATKSGRRSKRAFHSKSRPSLPSSGERCLCPGMAECVHTLAKQEGWPALSAR